MAKEVGELTVRLKGEIDERSIKKQKTRIQKLLGNLGLDVGSLKGKAGAMKDGAAGAIGGAMKGGGIMVLLGKIAIVLAAILGPIMVLMKIAETSLLFQRVIHNIMKSIKLILRPIGDMLGMIFMPFMFILRVLAKLISAMWKPYRKDIMGALKIQKGFLKQFMQTGDLEALASAYESGLMAIGYMMRPFFDLMIEGMAAGMHMITNIVVDSVRMLGNTFFDAIKGLIMILDAILVPLIGAVLGPSVAAAVHEGLMGAVDVVDTWKTEFNTKMDTLKSTLHTQIDLWKVDTQAKFKEMLDAWRGTLEERLANMRAAYAATLAAAEEDTGVFTEEMKEKYKELYDDLTNKTEDGRKKINDEWSKGMESMKTTTATSTGTITLTTTSFWDEFVRHWKESIGKLWSAIEDFVNWLSNIKIRTPSIPSYFPGPIFDDFVMSKGKMHHINPRDTVVGFQGNMPGKGGDTYNIAVNLSTQELADRILDAVKSYIDEDVSRKMVGY